MFIGVRRESSAVYPRACGEHAHSQAEVVDQIGLSPRLRGTPRSPPAGADRTRFIPAPAGNTPAGPLPDPRLAVYPRACGEHLFDLIQKCERPGLSPRLRGTHPGRADTPASCRFIPAPAGNTKNYGFILTGDSVYPRACGEHAFTGRLRLLDLGLSPRLRGTPRRHHARCAEIRFIPAPAGNTA